MNKAENNSSDWIGGPKTDLIFFCFGWVPVFLAFVLAFEAGRKQDLWPVLIAFVLMISFIHRHLTFPLVYADPDQLAARKKAYVLFPFLFFLLTLAGILYVEPGLGPKARPVRPLLAVLVFLSVVWNIYHTLMQKMGILRVYSRKAGYGRPWVDKAMIWVWFLFLLLQLAASPKVQQEVVRLSAAGRMLNRVFEPLLPVMPYLAGAALAAGLVITGFYLKQEFSHRGRFHWPKNLFVLSVLLLYATLGYDFVAGYAAFGFSHAIEYIAFVNVFSRRKYLARPAESSPLAAWIRRQGWSFGVFAAGMVTIFLLWRHWSWTTLGWYILASSFLHFLYDGWIWKVRDPKVAQPLGIRPQEA